MMTNGEWTTEPSELGFKDDATGLDCSMRRGPMGHWCGYVRLPDGHALHGVSYSDAVSVPTGYMDREVKMDEDYGAIALFCASLKAEPEKNIYPLDLAVRCHGGLTYSGMRDGAWWLGFDCAHSGDLCPQLSQHDGDVYRNVEYVKASLAKLCSDIEAIAPAQLKAA
jgi:hypothetical protein